MVSGQRSNTLMIPDGWQGVVLATVIAALTGCGTPIGNQQLLDFIQDDKTTREEVLLRLGEPSATFQNERILTYRVDQDDGGYIVVSKSESFSAKFSLVLSFDEDGVLRRHSLVRVKDVRVQ